MIILAVGKLIVALILVEYARPGYYNRFDVNSSPLVTIDRGLKGAFVSNMGKTNVHHE